MIASSIFLNGGFAARTVLCPEKFEETTLEFLRVGKDRDFIIWFNLPLNRACGTSDWARKEGEYALFHESLVSASDFWTTVHIWCPSAVVSEQLVNRFGKIFGLDECEQTLQLYSSLARSIYTAYINDRVIALFTFTYLLLYPLIQTMFADISAKMIAHLLILCAKVQLEIILTHYTLLLFIHCSVPETLYSTNDNLFLFLQMNQFFFQ